MKLVGSRSKKTHSENSDWDVMIDEFSFVSTEGRNECNILEFERSSRLLVSGLKIIARQKYNIPMGDKIDLFFQVYEGDTGYWRIVSEYGFCLRRGETIQDCEEFLTNPYDEGYY